MNEKITIAQASILYNLSKYGGNGASFVSHVTSAKSLIKKGFVEIVNGSYLITKAGCEKINLDYDDMIDASLKRDAKSIMAHYVMDVCITATEAELVEFAARYRFNNDPSYLIAAFIASGGEMTAAADEIEAEAPTEATLGDELYEESAVDVEEAPVFVPVEGEYAILIADTMEDYQRVEASKRYADGYYRIIRFDKEKGRNIVDRVHATQLRALYEETESTGPDRTETERAAMGTFDPKYDYLEMKPMFAHIEVGDTVISDNGVISEVTDVYPTIHMIDTKILLPNGSYFFCSLKESTVKRVNTTSIDPRDAEIEQLKAENAALKVQPLPSGVIAAYTRANAVTLKPYDDMDTYLRDWGMALENLYAMVHQHIPQETR